MTPEEKQLIDERIALSGLARAEFFINSCMHQKIVTFGNVRTFDEIKRKLARIDRHLQQIEKSEELDKEVWDSGNLLLLHRFRKISSIGFLPFQKSNQFWNIVFLNRTAKHRFHCTANYAKSMGSFFILLRMPQEALFARGEHSMQAAMRSALLRRGRSCKCSILLLKFAFAGN